MQAVPSLVTKKLVVYVVMIKLLECLECIAYFTVNASLAKNQPFYTG